MNLFNKKDIEERKVLEKFLSMNVKSSDEVFDEFAKLDNAQVYGDKPLKRFIYIPGTRKDRVLLVAHADTVWDKNYMPELLPTPQRLGYAFGKYYNENSSSLTGIGADDRAGCAILYLLKNSGHSLLILDGEEHGQIGANYLKNNYPALFKEINEHCYAIQFDRRNANDFKCYNILVTQDFKNHISKNLKMEEAGKKAKTDIVVLCEKMCGANLSVGYYGEHTEYERLDFKQWLSTYKKVSEMLQNEQKLYQTKQTQEEYEM